MPATLSISAVTFILMCSDSSNCVNSLVESHCDQNTLNDCAKAAAARTQRERRASEQHCALEPDFLHREPPIRDDPLTVPRPDPQPATHRLPFANTLGRTHDPWMQAPAKRAPRCDRAANIGGSVDLLIAFATATYKNLAIFGSVTGSNTPFSVTIPRINSAGVTSNAGL